jgi:hypothetical protein
MRGRGPESLTWASKPVRSTLGILVTFFLCFRAFAAAIEDAHIRVTLSEETGGIVSILNKDTGHDFISSKAEKPKLWELVIKTAERKESRVSSLRSERPTIKSNIARADLVWNGISVPGVNGKIDVRVSCLIEPTDQMVHLRIDIDNHSDASLISAVFPQITNLGKQGESDVAFPYSNWGELFKGLNQTHVGRYPSADMPMQFCSLSERTDSIYLAAHDPGAKFKLFRIKPGDEYSVETSIPDATVAGNDWHQPFDSVLGVYQGDWVTSCKIYRKWVLANAPWASRGPISNRKDSAPAVKEVGVWLNLDENYAQNEKNVLEFRKQMGVPIGVHWYFWHNNIMDRDLPDYLPPKPGFVDMVKRLNGSGIYSMPYINGRCWDTQNKNFGKARPYTSCDSEGKPNLEDYNSGTKLAVMCLGTRFWQNYLTDLIERVVDVTGTSGIYIDQLAGADLEECYNQQHGHTLGRDTWWIDGYRKSVTAARKHYASRPGGIFVAAENDAEPYMDFVDLFLIWIPRSENDIPMVTMVYSDYAQYFGANRGSDSDMSFAMMQTRDFTWGAQLFWESAYVLSPGQEQKLKVLKNLAQLRYRARKYLVDGELINVVQSINPIPKVTGKWGSWSLTLESRTLPAVHATLWKARDGTCAVVIANADINELPFTFEFMPPSTAEKEWQVTEISGRGVKGFGFARRGSQMMVNIPSRDGVILEFK